MSLSCPISYSVSCAVQGQQYMGLPLVVAAATFAGSALHGWQGAASSPTVASSTTCQKVVTTRYGTYSFNVVVTDQSSCSMGQSTTNSRGGLVGVHAPLDEPTVLLLHGFLGCAADWEHVAAALSLTCRCVSIDLPGHGASVVNATGVFLLMNTPSMPAVAAVRYADGNACALAMSSGAAPASPSGASSAIGQASFISSMPSHTEFGQGIACTCK